MEKATLSNIMKRGHEIARKLEGDYQARIAYGLKVAWTEHKAETKIRKRKKGTEIYILEEWFARNKMSQNIRVINIEHETEKAVLINFYEDHDIKTYTEWIPKSVVKKVIKQEKDTLNQISAIAEKFTNENPREEKRLYREINKRIENTASKEHFDLEIAILDAISWCKYMKPATVPFLAF